MVTPLHLAVTGLLVLPLAWLDSGYMVTSVNRGFLGYCTQVVREGVFGMPCVRPRRHFTRFFCAKWTSGSRGRFHASRRVHCSRGVSTLQVYFHGPLSLTVTCSVFAFGVQDYGSFWETTSRNVFEFSAIWFDSGYVFASVFVSVEVPQVSVSQQRQVRTVQTVLFVPTRLSSCPLLFMTGVWSRLC